MYLRMFLCPFFGSVLAWLDSWLSTSDLSRMVLLIYCPVGAQYLDVITGLMCADTVVVFD